ncbi:pyruvate dehydrogenase complex dihydrolipoamide acetyltransferase [Gluconacetobacter takamatsuzukensis]|uniref:Dihydrolipoamide acetyltransferase component of pyruvate dehydrogenase complex n=2 Tax=Gluconacetobacter takamatsuzukensis TaxID=1286190 RepID=A0A7W4PP23_9PROT|nr:2-oxo acid dehydrogenase subunit E2 [Gluconacetobacter takamatsuzukensis]MBB2204970.1 pyruvate dehydrogenase complex dihydrolipoamide acetyltransferase [Gluconacetobacter takamatsuzukensis]
MAVNICMPGPSSSPALATLARWLRSEGDRVMAGDVLAEIEADKATMEVEAPADGILGRILVPEGTPDVEADRIIGIVVRPGEDLPDMAGTDSTATDDSIGQDAAEAPPPERQATPSPPSTPAMARHHRLFASPVARRLARARGLDLSQVTGSGPGGRILRRDVESALPPAAQPAPTEHRDESEVRSVPISTMRRTIAQRLMAAKQTVPHFYVSVDIDADALLALRQEINGIGAEEESPDACRLSVNDMLIRAAALASKALPAVNTCWNEDAILFYRQIDIAIAVSVPDGLLTPVLRDAGGKSLATIGRESRALIARARTGKLRPEDMQGGCFTLSNAGMFGVDSMTAIINPPHAAILAVGAIARRPVIRQDQIAIASVMTCTLSADHRVIDGALAAQWLDTFRKLIEQPVRLMI